MSGGRVPLALVVELLETEPEPDALARADELDRQAARCEAEARRSVALRTGAADAWRERAAAHRREALEALRGSG